MTRLFRCAVVAMVLVPHPVRPLVAQTRDTIPLELAVALLAGTTGGPDFGAIRVGRLPSDVPQGIVPPGGSVIGSLDTGIARTLVLAFPLTPGEATDALDSHLRSAGWIPSQPNEPTKGFVVGSFAGTRPPLCNGGRVAGITAWSRPAGGSLVVLGLTPARPGGACGPPVARRSWDSDLPLPPLLPPPGMSWAGGGSTGGGGDSWHLETRLTGRRPAADILRHYADQLAAARWVSDPPALAEGAGVQSLRFSEDTGSVWYATLVVGIPAPGLTTTVTLLIRRQ